MRMRPILSAGTFLLAAACPGAKAADIFGFAPNPLARFTDALRGDALRTELLLNVAPYPSAPVVTLKREKAGSASIFGTIRNNIGLDICGLVLANGQFMFTCSPNGSYSLAAPLDGNNQLTLFGFADGHFPFKTVLGSSGGRYDIRLDIASQDPPPPPPPQPEATITFTITDACHDGYGINYRFWDETNNLVWPSSTTSYFTQFDDTPYASNLLCRVGANICYGARNTNPARPGYWGVDVDNSKSCTACCITCQQGNSAGFRLTC